MISEYTLLLDLVMIIISNLLMIKKSFNKLNLVKIRSDLIGNIQANYLYKLNILSFNYLSINFNLLKRNF